MTKAFNFPLNKVLNYRQNVEDTRGVILKKSMTVLEKEQEKLNNLVDLKNIILNEEIDEDQSNRTQTVAAFLQTIDYIIQLNEKIDSQSDNVNKSSMSVKKNRDELIQALKDRKSLEKLKEKYLLAYRKVIRKKELAKENEVAARIVTNKKTREIA